MLVQPKSAPLEAHCVTYKNRHEIAWIVGGYWESFMTGGQVLFGNDFARANDWVVRMPEGWKAFDDLNFRHKFTPVEQS